MLEERYGRVGRGASHLVLLSAVAIIFFAAVGLGAVAVEQFFRFEPFPLPPSSGVGRIAITVGLWLVGGLVALWVVYTLIDRWFVPRVEKRFREIDTGVLQQAQEALRERQDVFNETREMVQEWRNEFREAILKLSEADLEGTEDEPADT